MPSHGHATARELAAEIALQPALAIAIGQRQPTKDHELDDFPDNLTAPSQGACEIVERAVNAARGACFDEQSERGLATNLMATELAPRHGD
jgi:hypothetical protein